MKKLYLVLICIFFVKILFSQVYFKGKVVDTKNKGISGVKINILGINLGNTDEDGNFKVEYVKEGKKQTVEFFKLGFIAIREKIELSNYKNVKLYKTGEFDEIIKQKDALISSLNEKIEQNDALIISLNKTEKQKNRKIDLLEERIKWRDTKIASLKSEIKKIKYDYENKKIVGDFVDDDSSYLFFNNKLYKRHIDLTYLYYIKNKNYVKFRGNEISTLFNPKTGLYRLEYPIDSIQKKSLTKSYHIYYLSNSVGLLDKNNFIPLIPAKYSNIVFIRDNYYKVKRDNKWYLYNIYNKDVNGEISNGFDYIYKLSDFFYLKNENKIGIGYLKNGIFKTYIPISDKYKSFQAYGKYLIVEDTLGKKGIFNERFMTELIFDSIYMTEVSKNFMVLEKSKKIGLFNISKDSVVLQPIYKTIERFNKVYWIVSKKAEDNKEYYNVFKDTSFILEQKKYIFLKAQEDTLLLFKKENNKFFGLLNYKNDKQILKQKYLDIKSLSSQPNMPKSFLHRLFKINNNPLYICKNEKGWGIANDKKNIYHYYYDEIIIPKQAKRYLSLKKGVYYGYGNLYDNILIPPGGIDDLGKKVILKTNYIEFVFLDNNYAKVKEYKCEDCKNKDLYLIIDLKTNKIKIRNIHNVEKKDVFFIVKNNRDKYNIYDNKFNPLSETDFDTIDYKNNEFIGFFNSGKQKETFKK